MTERIGELLILGIAGTRLTAEEKEILRRVRPGGLILFRRNVEEAAQLHALVADIRAAAPDTLLYCDSEGGDVDRLAGIVGAAPPGEALAQAPVGIARHAGRAVGESLRCFGFDVDFAPVVDLDRGMSGNALDSRYLGHDTESVIARARSFLEGLHEAGVGGCLKHFPGLGPSRGDTHFEPGLVESGVDELAHDLEPFAELGPLARAVMVAHAVYPALDPERRPATLSEPILGEVLRTRLDFDGLAFSDDLEMKALDSWGSLEERAEATLVAGCDILPVCHTPQAAQGIVERLARPELEARVESALARLDAYRRHLAELRAQAPDRVPDLEHVREHIARVNVEAMGGHRIA